MREMRECEKELNFLDSESMRRVPAGARAAERYSAVAAEAGNARSKGRAAGSTGTADFLSAVGELCRTSHSILKFCFLFYPKKSFFFFDRPHSFCFTISNLMLYIFGSCHYAPHVFPLFFGKSSPYFMIPSFSI